MLRNKKWFYTVGLVYFILCFQLNPKAQCDIRNMIGNDGTMYYYLDTVTFYRSAEKQLLGTLVTDKESYFISLLPNPFPPRKIAEKLKQSLEVRLSNEKIYKLDHFYSNYNKTDSVFQIMFMIGKKDIEDFRKFDLEEMKIYMGESEGIRTYFISLHKKAISDNLACFIKKKE